MQFWEAANESNYGTRLEQPGTASRKALTV